MTLTKENGSALTTAKRLGAGAEGTVYETDDGQAAKIWHPSPENPQRAKKIAAMLGSPPVPDLHPKDPRPQDGAISRSAWPTAVIYDDNRTPTGFLMPLLKADRHRVIFHHFNAQARKRAGIANDERDLLRIGRNLARAVGEIHAAGHVIGDVNEMNTLVSNALAVTLVDTDSMQIKDKANAATYRCLKGRDDYTPPRLQGGNFADRDRTAQDDAFGLAVLIFKLQMDGVHPFASTSDPDRSQSISLADKIRREYFPYNESGHTPAEHQPSRPYRDAWQDLDFRLRHLFRRAFDPQATASEPRPNADEWATELNRLILDPPKRRRPEVRTSTPKTEPPKKEPQPPPPPGVPGQPAWATPRPQGTGGGAPSVAGGGGGGIPSLGTPGFVKPPTMAAAGAQYQQQQPQNPTTARQLIGYAAAGFFAMAALLVPIYIFAGPGF